MGQKSLGAENVCIVAFYLPQFHRTPYNDEWWGEGFTEWTNVRKAKPVFKGHQQPKIPSDLGYYDASDPATIRSQIRLAKEHGVDAFCVYSYWFNGKKLLHKPLDLIAGNEEDFSFLLCWANENWTKRWDGGDGSILVEQKYGPGFEEAYLTDNLDYLTSKNYLVNESGEPILVIYRVDDFPEPAENVRNLRKAAVELGLPGLDVKVVNSFADHDPSELGASAAIEFPPLLNFGESRDFQSLSNRRNEWNGSTYDYESASKISMNAPIRSRRVHPGLMPGWDNTPRRQWDGVIFRGQSSKTFALWLFHHVARELDNSSQDGDKPLVFINAWNEWAEGAFLEPDESYGLTYLDAIKRVRHIRLGYSTHLNLVGLKGDVQLEVPSLNGFGKLLSRAARRSDLARKVANWALRSKFALNLLRRFTLKKSSSSITRIEKGYVPILGSEKESLDSITLHLHLHKTDLIEDLAVKIESAVGFSKVILTLTSELQASAWRERLASSGAEIHVVDNLGRNFGPLFSHVLTRVESEHILHLHYKRSAHFAYGEEWREFLWDSFGDWSKGRHLTGLLSLMRETGSSVAFPAPLEFVRLDSFAWHLSFDFASRAFPEADPKEFFVFPAGGMFLSRTSLLRGVADIVEKNQFEYEPEPIGIDGYLPHFIERAIGYVPLRTGGNCLVFERLGDEVVNITGHLERAWLMESIDRKGTG